MNSGADRCSSRALASSCMALFLVMARRFGVTGETVITGPAGSGEKAEAS